MWTWWAWKDKLTCAFSCPLVWPIPLVAPSVITSSIDFSFQNLVFYILFELGLYIASLYQWWWIVFKERIYMCVCVCLCVILDHILGRERCICCLWSFVNVFAFVSKHIEIFRDQIQTWCLYCTYAIVKTSYDELSICYIPFAYVYSKLRVLEPSKTTWIST
jgi:hypothetical protein